MGWVHFLAIFVNELQTSVVYILSVVSFLFITQNPLTYRAIPRFTYKEK